MLLAKVYTLSLYVSFPLERHLDLSAFLFALHVYGFGEHDGLVFVEVLHERAYAALVVVYLIATVALVDQAYADALLRKAISRRRCLSVSKSNETVSKISASGLNHMVVPVRSVSPITVRSLSACRGSNPV